MRVKSARSAYYFCAKPSMIMQRGSALITALFIMTLVAIAATAMSTRLQLDIYRTGLTISHDKLYLASQAVAFWAMDTLTKPSLSFNYKSQKKGKLMDFPHPLQHKYPDVFVTGELYDLQARFNINNLQNTKYHPLFIRLMGHIQHKMEATQRQLFTNAIVQWISPYKAENGADDSLSFYLTRPHPYYTSHQPMQNISELRLVRGFNRKIYQSFLPYVTALPSVTPININTAPKFILMSLGNGLNETQLSELIEARGSNGIQNTNKLRQLLQKLGISGDQITTESEYYLSKSVASSHDLTLTTYTILQRHKDPKGKISIGIVSEELNV